MTKLIKRTSFLEKKTVGTLTVNP